MGKAEEKAAVCSSIIYGVMAKTHKAVMLNGISSLLLTELKKVTFEALSSKLHYHMMTVSQLL